MKVNLPFEIPEDHLNEALGWATTHLQKDVKTDIENFTKERSTVQLFPPGTCIHLYRDGVGVTACYTPCDFFSEFDVSRTMVDDHLIATGYDRLFHEWARQQTHSRFFFRNDVALLRAEVHRQEEPNESEKTE